MHSVVHARSRFDLDASPHVVPLRGLDPDQLAEVIRGARFDHCQLGQGSLTGELISLPLGTTQVDAAHLGADMGLRGVLPEHAGTLLLIQDTAPGLVVNATPLRRGDLLLCPPGARIDAFLPGSTRWLALQAHRASTHPARMRPGNDVACFRPALHARARLLDHAAELLATARTEPQRFGSRSARENAAARLTALLQAALDGAAALAPDGGALPSRRREAVRLACDVMLERLEHPVSAGTLCDLAGVSPRALAYYFQQTLGVSPMAWYRAHRFAAARRALLRGDTTLSSVTAVAIRFGFLHLGRFSVEYRALFHESPSETLARSRLGAGRSQRVCRRPAVRTRRAQALTV